MSELNIAYPPDFVFKYKKNRLVPAQEVITEQTIYNFEKMKYPPLKRMSNEFFAANGIKREDFDLNFTAEEEKMGGQLAYFTGTLYPSKGHPFPHAIYAMNFCKRIIRTGLSLIGKEMKWVFMGFLLTSKKNKLRILSKVLDSYSDICLKVASPYVLDELFLTSSAGELLVFVKKFLIKLGINELTASNFASVLIAPIEYDNAYRLRIEDIMSETSKERMLKNPRKELIRLGEILKERDKFHGPIGTGERNRKMFKTIAMVLLYPPFKRIFKECVKESNFGNFQYDDADRYHVLLIEDYDFLGLSIGERIERYKEFHRDVGFPPRMTYKTSS